MNELKRSGKIGSVKVALLVVFVWLVMTGYASGGVERWNATYDGYSTGMLPFMPQVVVDGVGDRILAYTAYTLDSSGEIAETHWRVVSYDPSGSVNWEREVRGTEGLCYLSALTVDLNNDVIAGGAEKNSRGDYDWKIVKFSSEGSVLLERRYDSGRGDDWLNDLQVDSRGNIIGAGTCAGESGFNEWMVRFFLTDGSAKEWQVSGVQGFAYRVAVDSRDDVVVGGEVTEGGDKDWKVISYAPGGTKVNWEVSFDSSRGDDHLYDIAVDEGGDVVAVGKVHSSKSYYDYDWQVICYGVSGSTATVRWSDRIDGDGDDDSANGVSIDGDGNLFVGGYVSKGGYRKWFLLSYNATSGVKRWSQNLDGEAGDSAVGDVAVAGGVVVATGYSSGTSYRDWRVIAYAAADGSLRWDDLYDGGDDELAMEVAMDSGGGAFVAGVEGKLSPYLEFKRVRVADYAGEGGFSPPLLDGHVLKPGEVRTIESPPQSPDPQNGLYLGFGDVVRGGASFKLQAAFPSYVNAERSFEYQVKVFIAAQLPDDYSRLLYLTEDGRVEYQPPDALSSWREAVKGGVSPTTILELPASSLPSGVQYWYTLVVPWDVPDNFDGVDWNAVPWEITVDVLNLP